MQALGKVFEALEAEFRARCSDFIPLFSIRELQDIPFDVSY